MSKERARRRAVREHEAALRRAARAAEAERRERRAARRRRLRALAARSTAPVRLSPTVGRHAGVLARRRRLQDSMLLAVLAVLNVLVWVVRGDFEARLGALLVSALAFPVLRVLLFARR